MGLVINTERSGIHLENFLWLLWLLDSDFVVLNNIGFATYEKKYKNSTSFLAEDTIAHAKGALDRTAFVFRENVCGVITSTFNTT